MKLIDELKSELIGEIFTNEYIDSILEKNKYYPVEDDEEQETDILKYSNKKSQIWVKYVGENDDYLVSDVTMKTKKTGKATVHAFRNADDIKGIMDYFRDINKDDEFLIFMFGILLARRIGDILSLKWSDFYYENGRKKEILNTLIEQKTDKIVDISVTNVTWKYVDWYCNKKDINPLEHFNEDIFPTGCKSSAKSNKEYRKAISKQASSFRYEFKKAAETVGVENVSTHSMRKSFGYIAHEIHRFDPDCLPTLQTVLGHSDLETTKRYIDIMNDKAKEMFVNVGKYVEDIDNGLKPAIDNMPVIALRTNDLRDILKIAYMKGKELDSDLSDIEIMNQLISMVEERRVS